MDILTKQLFEEPCYEILQSLLKVARAIQVEKFKIGSPLSALFTLSSDSNAHTDLSKDPLTPQQWFAVLKKAKSFKPEDVAPVVAEVNGFSPLDEKQLYSVIARQQWIAIMMAYSEPQTELKAAWSRAMDILIGLAHAIRDQEHRRSLPIDTDALEEAARNETNKEVFDALVVRKEAERTKNMSKQQLALALDESKDNLVTAAWFRREAENIAAQREILLGLHIEMIRIKMLLPQSFYELE